MFICLAENMPFYINKKKLLCSLLSSAQCPHAGFTFHNSKTWPVPQEPFVKKLKKVCSGVAIEPALIPILGKTVGLKCDVNARGF